MTVVQYASKRKMVCNIRISRRVHNPVIMYCVNNDVYYYSYFFLCCLGYKITYIYIYIYIFILQFSRFMRIRNMIIKKIPTFEKITKILKNLQMIYSCCHQNFKMQTCFHFPKILCFHLEMAVLALFYGKKATLAAKTAISR